MCSWDRVPTKPEDSASMPVTGGSLFQTDVKHLDLGCSNALVGVVALNSKSLEKFGPGKCPITDDLFQLMLDVVESQNPSIHLKRHTAKFMENLNFVGDFWDTLDKAFPGIKEQMNMEMELPKQLDNLGISNPADILNQLASSQKDEEKPVRFFFQFNY